MPPGGNCPAARCFFASATVSWSRNRWEGFPKSSATWGTSVAITRCVHPIARARAAAARRSEEHTSELQSRGHLVCRLLLEKKKKKITPKRTNTLDSSKDALQAS